MVLVVEGGKGCVEPRRLCEHADEEETKGEAQAHLVVGIAQHRCQ